MNAVCKAKVHICKICGKSFTYKDTRGTITCSKSCAKKHWRNIKIGKLNPRFNDGWRQYHRIMKDVTKCHNCGRKYTLEIHHKDGNRKNNKKSNLIKVCRRCHMLLDGRFKNLNHNNSNTGLCKGGDDK